jgi:hypothetical protein
MACRRDYHSVVAGVAIGAAAALGGFLPLVANHGLTSVVTSVLEGQEQLGSDKLVSTESTWTRIDAVALIGKLTGKEPGALAQLAVFVACMFAAGFALWKIRDTPSGTGADSLSALIICTATLACSYHATYSALLIVGPWVALSFGRLRTQVSPTVRAAIWLLLSIVAVNYVSTRLVITRFSIEEPLLMPLTMVNSVCITMALMLAISSALVKRAPLPAMTALPSGSG